MNPEKSHVHFIAIGGSAMHNLAIALKQQGYSVTGSDDDIFEPSRSRLAGYGLLPTPMGWYPEKITAKTHAVILGMHARENNPELRKARLLGLNIYSFPDFIYKASEHATRVVIAGSHGKTTITSIIIHVLKFHDRDFDYLVGAGIPGFENMVRLSGASLIILEGDEYLSSALDKTPKFIRYKHHIGLLSGIAWDHINAFPSRELYVDQFRKFIGNTPEKGVIIYQSEDQILKNLVKEKQFLFRIIPYGTPSYLIRSERYYLETRQKTIPLRIFGRHNMQNLAGAIKVLHHIGITDQEIYQAIPSFSGASNRLEKILDADHIKVYKDFAHSPSKLHSTIQAVRELYPHHKIISCYELHTYSSLNKYFLNEYQHTMDQGDINIIFVNDHTLKMKQMPYLEDRDIHNGFSNTDIKIYRKKEDLVQFLLNNMDARVILLLMSSGNFGGLDYNLFCEKLKKLA